MRAHLQSLATWMQKLRSFFEALRLDDIAFCKLERLNRRKTVAYPYPCAVGRMTISFTSTSAGCSMANAIARAIAAGGIANLSRDAASWALTSGLRATYHRPPGA